MTEVEDKYSTGVLMKRAAGLGAISIFSYLASYFLRNLLSVATPNMLASGEYTAEFIGLLSSAYFLTYAIGQFLNGIIGDMMNPKYMIGIGLCFAGTVSLVFSFVPLAWMQVVCFAAMGFGLSMIRGPIMKMISENLPQNYARTVCTCLSVASFSGPLIASAFAMIFQQWSLMFTISGILTLAIAMIAFITLTVFEKKQIFVFQNHRGVSLKGYLSLFRLDNFVFYLIVGGVVEIAGSAITFWIPTYLSDALHFDIIASNVIYSVISVISALAPFLTLFLFKLLKERDVAMIRAGFLISVVFFLMMLVMPSPWLRALALLIAKLSLSCCSSVLWSIYIPGMGSTGKVSGINGIINCIGYLSAAVANAVFAKLLNMSWSGVICVWCGIAAIGLIASLILAKTKKETLEC